MIEPLKKGWPKIPESLDEIIKIFGDPFSYYSNGIFREADWHRDKFGFIDLPLPICLSFDLTIEKRRSMVHKRMIPVFNHVYSEIMKADLWQHLNPYGGCYCFRSKKSSSALSTHAWAISADFNPAQNRLGTKGIMPEEVIKIFEQCGFTWGGRWTGRWRDPMHFQYAKGA